MDIKIVKIAENELVLIFTLKVFVIQIVLTLS